MSKKNKEDQADFEILFDELTQLVELMERGGASLEASLKQFERGVELVSKCQNKLDNAALRVKQLIQKEEKEMLVQYDHMDIEEKD